MQAQDDEAKLRECYRILFASHHGKEVLGDLLSNCFYDKTTFAHGLDALDLAFNEGSRTVVLHILAMQEPVQYEALDQQDIEDEYDG